MLGNRDIFVVRGLLGRGVGKCEFLADNFAIHEESGSFTGCRFCETKSGRRQITHHDGGVVTSNDSPGVCRKSDSAKIQTGIDEPEQGGSEIVSNGAVAEEYLGVSINTDSALLESALLPLF